MRRWSRAIRVALMLCLVAGLVHAGNPTDGQRRKLHPAFQAVVAQVVALQKAPASSPRATVSVAADGAVLYDAIVHTRDADALRAAGIRVNSVYPDFVTAQLTRSDLLRVADLESVTFLDPGTMNYPQLDVSVVEIGARLLHAGFINNTSYRGAGAIVLIYDTGIDWRHLDFRKSDTTKSRILFIWDQTITPQGGETSPSGFAYGVEYTKAQIEDELNKVTTGAIREADINGHGTHVAGTAAGNGLSYNQQYIGVAPDADIIVVKGGNGSFSESRMIDGLTYASNKATALGKPIVVNWSIGGQTGAHDGTRPYEAAVNTFVATPGRVACIAAGNDGAKTIHTSGSVSSSSPATIQVTVPSYTPTAGTENDYFLLDIWLSSSSQAVTISVTSPNGVTYSRDADLSGTGPVQTDGTIDLYNYVGSNSHRNMQLYVHDATASTPATGTWTVTLTTTGGSVNYDGWIGGSSLGGASVTLVSGNTSKTVSMPGTASGAITVASYVTKWNWQAYDNRTWWYGSPDRTGNISTFSSIGPTADGRQKPEIAAPGQGIAAALSSSVDTSTIGTRIMKGVKHHLTQGTSMATPHVAGTSALLLGANASLTAAQIKSAFTSTARSDGFATGLPNVTWGYGKLDAYASMASVLGATGGSRVNLSYAGAASASSALPAANWNRKFAERFTPSMSGKLTSVSFTLNSGSSGVSGNSVLRVSAAQNVAGSFVGIPGAQIGSTVTVPFGSLSAGAVNVVDMSSAGITVTNGVDFHVVLEVDTTIAGSLQFLLDDGSLLIDRTSAYRIGALGWGWYNRCDTNYNAPPSTGNHRNLLMTATIAHVATDVPNEPGAAPQSFVLAQNYPNPFNPETAIRYQVSSVGRVDLRVYDLLGREVAALVNEQKSPGTYEARFDGAGLASGVYLYRLRAGNLVETRKMLLLK